MGGTHAAKREFIVGIGTEISVLIHHRNGEVDQVFAIGCKSLSVGLDDEMMGLTGGSHHFFGCFVAFGIVGHHLQFAGFIDDVVPAQAITV